MSVLRFRNNETGEWNEITTIKGEPGAPGPAGKDGQDGKDYVLTDADKQEIAGMIEVPGGGGGSGWSWQDAYGATQIDISNYTHVKLAFDYDGNIVTLDVSTTNNNYFSEENGTYYTCVYYNDSHSEVSGVSFYNQWGTLQNLDYVSNYTFLGYYYQ